jgi:preprotein translocase SecF subunit
MRIFEQPTFDFLKARKVAYVISGVLFLASLFAIFTRGLQYGIDFKGGVEIVLEFDEPVAVNALRSTVGDALDSSPEVKKFGSDRDLLIRTDQGDRTINELQNALVSAVQAEFTGNNVSVIKTDIVGPRFAEDLKAGALQAILFSMVLIFIYILIRFKTWYFSAGAVLALIHDVVIVLGIFTILSEHVPFNLQIDQAIIAAFLTIVGYSLNDTVVVFDRIRENKLVHKTMDFAEMVNTSLNDTLSRTVITSVTTLFVVLVLFIFGGEVLKGFSFALVLGVIIGTYSSLFVASSSVIELNRRAELKS